MSPDLLQMPLPGRSTYNEFAPDGVTPRPYWSAFIDSVQELGPDELVRRWERAERRIRENDEPVSAALGLMSIRARV